MRVLEIANIRLEWKDIEGRVRHYVPTQSMVRSTGIHLSGVLRYVAVTSGVLRNVDSTSGKWAGDGDLDEDEMPIRMALGMAWEQWAAGLYPQMHYQPGEMELEEVFGTVDGLSEFDVPGITDEDNYTVLLEEFKATWKSCRNRAVTGEWLWMQQVKGYLKMLQESGYPGARWARMHVFYVNGDYRPPAPIYMRYLIEFTQEEINASWDMVMRNRDNPAVKKEIH